ncbi:MAG: FeoA domain-containing protein [Acidimicrobiales bacterium]
MTEQVEVDTGPLEYLNESGLAPGVDTVILSKAPDGTLTVEVAGAAGALGPAISRQLFVVSAVPA